MTNTTETDTDPTDEDDLDASDVTDTDAVDQLGSAEEVLTSFPPRPLNIATANALAEATDERLIPCSMVGSEDDGKYAVVTFIYFGERDLVSIGFNPLAKGWVVIRRDEFLADPDDDDSEGAVDEIADALDEWAAEKYGLGLTERRDD